MMMRRIVSSAITIVCHAFLHAVISHNSLLTPTLQDYKYSLLALGAFMRKSPGCDGRLLNSSNTQACEASRVMYRTAPSLIYFLSRVLHVKTLHTGVVLCVFTLTQYLVLVTYRHTGVSLGSGADSSPFKDVAFCRVLLVVSFPHMICKFVNFHH